MAIYGDFDSHSFNDIIRILQRHAGTLFMPTALDGRSVEIHLDQGALCAVFIDNTPIHEVLEVQEVIQSLVNHATGEYNFSFNERVVSHHFSLPIMDLIREAMGTAQIPEQQLPHQSVQFKSVLKVPPVPDSLQSNWMMLQPLLKNGVSAEEVTDQLQLSVLEVRVVLYRLRAAGLIEPQRAVDTYVPQSSRRGLVRRLLNTLRRLTKGGAT